MLFRIVRVKIKSEVNALKYTWEPLKMKPKGNAGNAGGIVSVESEKMNNITSG